ncbi:MAG: metallophosphoesterase family protein [Bacteroidales bacterium]|nr:metallophosphoesterase family protein [Bacteroidales bacterium]
MRESIRFASIILFFFLFQFSSSYGQDLPVKKPDLPRRSVGMTNEITLDQVYEALQKEGNEKGLFLDFGNPALQGKIYSGPYPYEEHESDLHDRRYRLHSSLKEGRGLIPIARFFEDKYDANEWVDSSVTQAAVAVRIDLWEKNRDDVHHHGFRDILVYFKREDGRFRLVTTISEGPFVNLLRSDDGDPSGTGVTISWETMQPSGGKVVVKGVDEYAHRADDLRDHQIEITGLRHDTRYKYYVQSGETRSSVYSFKTAPRRGQGNVTIAYTGDSREGVGGGEHTFMGVNRYILRRLADDAYRRGAEIFLFGGDLVNGYTTDVGDFRTQLKAWKQAMEGFAHSRALYPAQGNHESLLNAYGGEDKFVMMDKFPYHQSAEAIFAEEFVLPKNGPSPEDIRRPSYKEEVYAFQYGPVKIIAFNNNYWFTSNHLVNQYGGSPEGYIMPDQLRWIIRQIQQGDQDPSVKAILMFAQEPVFPNGGHVGDAMWYGGNNNIRAYTDHGGRLIPEEDGIIEVRNKLWRAVSRSKKVAAVLTSDEHGYHRTLIDNDTPVGIMDDDTDGDGRLEKVSPNRSFVYPTWHITSGGGGAPYYAQEQAPWSDDVALYSSQFNYTLIRFIDGRMQLDVYNHNGQRIDHLDDLLHGK